MESKSITIGDDTYVLISRKSFEKLNNEGKNHYINYCHEIALKVNLIIEKFKIRLKKKHIQNSFSNNDLSEAIMSGSITEEIISNLYK
nr:hypothetical protein [Candidatus Gracilibacteria bacterium]